MKHIDLRIRNNTLTWPQIKLNNQIKKNINFSNGFFFISNNMQLSLLEISK